MNYVCDGGCGFGHGGAEGLRVHQHQNFHTLDSVHDVSLIICSKLIPPTRKQNELKHFRITTDVLKTKQHRRSFTNWLLLLIKACLQDCIYFGVLSKCMTSCFNPHLYCFISPIQ